MNETRTLKIKDIKPSSVGNVRHDLGDLKELTASIKKSGVLQPLTVRPEPDGDGFELVFGQRRLAAAKAAKLDEVPVIARALKDLEVIELQLVENIQREDIHPLDESLGYQRLRDDFDRGVEALVQDTGKSKAYIYAALKLTDLTEHAQAKFRKGDFDASVALYVARLGTEAAQKQACIVVSEVSKSTGEKPSAREAFDIVKKLEKKIELDEKWEKTKARAIKNEDPVLSEAAAKNVFSHANWVDETGGYLNLAKEDYDHPKQLTYEAIVKNDMPQVILAQDPHSHETFRLCTKKEFATSVKRIYGAKGYKPERSGMSESDRKAAEKAAAERKFSSLATPLVGEKALSGPGVNFLRALLALFFERCSYGTVTNALIKPFEGRKYGTYKSTILGFNEKELKDELLTLALQGASQSEFANVCNLLKVAPSAILKIKAVIAEDAKAKAAAAKKRAKNKAAQEKVEDESAPKGPVLKKKGSKKKKS